MKKLTRNMQPSDDVTISKLADKVSASLSLKTEADIHQLKTVLNFIKDNMKNYCLDEGTQFNLIVAAEEIFANIATYAYKDHERGKVEITYFVRNNTFYVQFTDNGVEFNPLQQEKPDISLDLQQRDIGGLGVFLAKTLSDEFMYKRYRKQNITTIGMALKK